MFAVSTILLYTFAWVLIWLFLKSWNGANRIFADVNSHEFFTFAHENRDIYFSALKKFFVKRLVKKYIKCIKNCQKMKRLWNVRIKLLGYFAIYEL